MNRREFLVRSGIAGAGLGLSGRAGVEAAARRPQSVAKTPLPNILFLFTDQWRHDIFGYAGHRQVRTPNLDRLARQSMNFERAYCPSPACGPSRASLFTGCYPAEHGQMRNANPHDRDKPLFTDKLRSSGYTTGLVGKLHLHTVDDSHGFDWKRLCDAHYDTYSDDETRVNAYFDALALMRSRKSRAEWVSAGGRTEALGPAASEFWLGESWVDDAAHHTTWTADEAGRFLQEAASDQPWFLNVSFFGPHHPYTTAFPWSELYAADQIELPATLREAKTSPVFEALKHKIHGEMAAWNEDVWQQMVAQYLGYCSQIDAAIGRVLNQLAQREDAANTWVVFASDHGDHLGNWGLLGKADPYETAIRVPLLICPPGGLAAPRRYAGAVNLIDLHASFLEMGGQQDVSGSLLPLIESESTERDGTFVFQGWATDNYHAVWVDSTRKLIACNRPDGRRLYEAYDLARDHEERFDVWPKVSEDPEWALLMRRLDLWTRSQETAIRSRG